jgi:hypothetical protein
MKRILAISAAALLSGSLFAAPALAQVSVDTGTGVDVGIGASGDSGSGSADGSVSGTVGTDTQIKTDNMGAAADTDANANLDTSTTAAIGGSWDGLMSAMGDSSASGSISSMTEVSDVNVIKIGELENADMDALATAKTDNQASIDELHSSLEANASVKAALDAQGVDASDVVAANVAADGSLTVYVE